MMQCLVHENIRRRTGHEERNYMRIIKTDAWNREGVRQVCIDNWFYTGGDCEAYENMLEYVKENPPKKKNIYRVAKDIHEHSRVNISVADIMFILRKDAVRTFYRIEREEGKCLN